MDIWIYETSGATELRRLTNGGNNRFPVWSRDGEHVAFQSDRDGKPGIFLQKFDGTGSAERLTTADGQRSHIPEDWSPTKDLLAFTVLDGAVLDGAQAELWMWSQSDRKTTRFGTMQSASLFDAVFSPDGRWLAYSQRNSARWDQQRLDLRAFCRVAGGSLSGWDGTRIRCTIRCGVQTAAS